MRIAIAVLAAFGLTACSSLRLFPAAAPVCDAQGSLTSLWRCVGVPDPAPKEGGLASTLRVANGDLTRRLLLNQTPSLSCNTRPWRGFEHVSQPIAGVDRLEAFVHNGDPRRPVIFVVHG